MEKKTIELSEKITFVSHSQPGAGPVKVEVSKLVIRAFEEEEFFKHWDKRLKFEIASNRGDTSIDLYDSGDEEIVGVIESPPPDITRELLEEKPAICEGLTGWLYSAAGLLCSVKKLEEYAIDPAVLEQNGNRVIAIEVEGKVFLIRKLSRMSYKLLQKDIAAHGFVSSKNLALQVKNNVLADCKDELESLCKEKPFVYLAIGKLLLDETGIKLNEFAGKA